ncbi:thiamine diphosphokinase [Mesobacillus zeae]|uniref:Thiamine diphosphokinase n=1 Tax=Mesobacillus zeae TaxID=1917180 RepID=A0A398BKQ6_9BACI|nr:thiamine diphosphokinase [Mesobacillus zeae]RID87953.1 thiamine diphosphokinase [Mesobacillus zeae]
MIINIVAGGPDELLPDLGQYNDRCIWAGVDRGVFTLLEAGIAPGFAFGDFDSVKPWQMAEIEGRVKDLKRFKPEKDATDMELALDWALSLKPKKVRLFGATGGRIDHMLANIQLLVRPLLENLETIVEIIDSKNIVWATGPGVGKKISLLNDMKYISFVPASASVTGLTLDGFKYPLKDMFVPFASTLCISNELTGKSGTFSFTEGILLVVRSKD